MKLAPHDEIVSCVPVTDSTSVLVMYAYGKGKRVRMNNWRVLGRNAQGRWIFPHRKRSELGPVAGIELVSDEDDVALVSANSMLVRIRGASVSCVSSAASGVKIMGLEDGDRIAAVTALPPSPQDQEENGEEEQTLVAVP